ncbi:MAG: DUF192 domain-containing protein [Brevinematales bacterium]|jgi:uncharacterized membrane protein (UPF0127 family)
MISIILLTNVLNIEIASTMDQKSLGLMNRRSWNGTDGMLFINKEPENVSYWMKNTYLNLTMYFMDEDLNIIEVYNPEPMSTDIISSRSDNIKYILELNPALTNTLSMSYPVFRKKLIDRLASLKGRISPED